ncbi:MAG: hypothetical protein J7467_04100, partial [Chloroflexus sp.]|nr:hypothetical protein [Chloroflexus sp.]
MAEVTPPDLTLVVFRDPAGRMQFTLHRDNITLCYVEQTLPRPLDALINAPFDDLHLLQRGTDLYHTVQTAACQGGNFDELHLLQRGTDSANRRR